MSLFVCLKCGEPQTPAKRAPNRCENPNCDGEGFAESPTITSAVHGELMVEQILNDDHPRFAVWDGATVLYKDNFEYDGVTYTPVSNDLVDKKVVKFPNKAEDYGDVQTLIDDIKAHVKKYLDVSTEFYELGAWYVLLTWVYDSLNTIPYLRALGDYGTGKSRLLDVLGGVCYKTCTVSGAVTPAPIYRIIEQFKGTLIIDEGDLRHSDEKNEVITILNCGFERGKPILRCQKDNPDNLQTFDAFCPKIISSRQPFWDQALESRCITEPMGETSRIDIPEVLPPEFFEEQKTLRNKLLMYRFKNLKKINSTVGSKVELSENIAPRLRQSSRAFFCMFADNLPMVARFKDYLNKYQIRLVKIREETIEGQIIAEIWRCACEQADIRVGDIKVKNSKGNDYNSGYIGRILAGMKVERKVMRLGDETARCIVWDRERMKKIFQRYVSAYHEVVTGVTPVTSITGTKALAYTLFSDDPIPVQSTLPGVVV